MDAGAGSGRGEGNSNVCILYFLLIVDVFPESLLCEKTRAAVYGIDSTWYIKSDASSRGTLSGRSSRLDTVRQL